jgi:TPR repeat protein
MPDEPPGELSSGAQAGDPAAQCLLGRWYAEHGSDIERAEEWFHRSAEQGFVRAKHNLGILAWQTNRGEAARQWLGAAVADGWVPSIVALGGITEVAGDLPHAVALYERAAARGHADAQDALGRIAFDRETEDGYAASRYWSELAAAQGNPYAQVRLATIYHEGLGVARDPARAVSLWLSAARLGHAGAQLMVGVAYHTGTGIGANLVESAYWLLQSVAQGNKGAAAYLPDVQDEMTSADEAALWRLFAPESGSP